MGNAALIVSLKPYATMKDTGLPWLGSVPNHWEIKRGKNLFRCIDIRSRTGDEELLTVSSVRGVIPRSATSVTMFQAESYVGHKLCWPGDLVINSLWAWAKGLGVSRYHGIVSTAYGVYRLRNPEQNSSDFFHELVRSSPFQWELQVRSKGIWTSRLQLTDYAFLDAPFPVPPPNEQVAIVRFLNHADRRIRRVIRTKQKMIALLNEQKQAIIHQAVTRGLDPGARLKPSGVEWLGELPEHWDVRRLKTLVRRIDQGVSPQAENYLAESGSWGVVKAGCVNRGIFRETEHKRLPSGFVVNPALSISVGDILVSRASGSPQLVGSAARVGSLNYRLILSDKTFRPILKEGVDPAFMVLAMNSSYYRQQVERAISGAEGLANNLPLSSLKTFIFAIPPQREQSAVAEAISEITGQLAATLQRAEAEISLLKEYHARLIADVVTGQLDVRAAVAQLQDEVEEAEANDALDLLEDIEEAGLETDLDIAGEVTV